MSTRASAGVSAAVLQLDLHTMAAGIIRTTVQQAEKDFEADRTVNFGKGISPLVHPMDAPIALMEE